MLYFVLKCTFKFNKNRKKSKMTKYFFVLLFVSTIQIGTAQCPLVDIHVLEWDNKTLTLKWRCNPKPAKGKFYVYRACVSQNRHLETLVDSVSATQNYEFSDNDKQLKTNLTYQYRVQYGKNKPCSNSKQTQGRVIEEDSSTTEIGFVKDIKTFNQKAIVHIQPLETTAKPNNYLSVKLEIKDFKYNFSSRLKYALICENTVFETDSEATSDDFRYAKVFILGKIGIYEKCKIALIQGNEIIGVSELIEIK